MTVDREIAAMKATSETFEGLEEGEVRQRVLNYLNARYGGRGKIQQEFVEAEEPEGDRTFGDVADLMEAAGAGNNTARALVAAYWVQELQSNPTFASQTVNKHLKQLGYTVANITMTFNSLIDRKPAYLMQTKKSGSSKQARKQYKLTAAGVKRVKEMLTGPAADDKE